MTEIGWQLYDVINRHRLTVRAAMNQLDEAGIISNNVIHLSDISDHDARQSIRYLNEHSSAQ